MAADGSVAFVALCDGAVASCRRIAVLAFDGHAARTSGHALSFFTLRNCSSVGAPYLRGDGDQPRDCHEEHHPGRDTRETSDPHGYSFAAAPLGAPASSFGMVFKIRARWSIAMPS